MDSLTAGPYPVFQCPDSDATSVLGNGRDRRTGSVVGGVPVLTAPRHQASLRQTGHLTHLPRGLGPGLGEHLLPFAASPRPPPPREICVHFSLPSASTSTPQVSPSPPRRRRDSFPCREARPHRPAPATEGGGVHDLPPGTLRSCPNASRPRSQSGNTSTPSESPVLPRVPSLSSSR